MAEDPQRPSNNDHVLIPVSQRDTTDSRGMNASNLNTFTEGTVLSFHNISYREKVKRGFLLQKTHEIELLSNASGIMKPGLNVIMGPQDGGRSLLLDVLAGRKDPHGLTGNILINGAPQPANFRCNSGYVSQNDMVLCTMTVRENIQFSAALRLPETVTSDQRNERVNKVIELLGLDKVANSKARSKEDQKRTSIAMELVTDHSILFLDEPTTGLNAKIAHGIIVLLKRMAKQERTIIISINQPQFSIFDHFDSLTLVASGKVMFHGSAQKALEFFQSAGYHCENNHPADFLLGVIDGIISGKEEREGENKLLFQKENSVTEKLAECFTKSLYYQETKAELDQLSAGQEMKGAAFPEMTYATSFWHQLRWMMWRSFKNLTGFPRVTMIQVIITILLAAIMGFIFLGISNDCTEVQNSEFSWEEPIMPLDSLLGFLLMFFPARAILLYLLTSLQCITSVSAGELFVIEEKHFLHEHMGGYYRVTPYFLGKLISELIPRRLLPTIIFTFIVYSIVGVKTDWTGVIITLLTFLILAYTASSLSLSIGAGENAVAVPTLLMNIYFMFMLIFSGLQLYSGTLMPQLSWLLYLSIPHYGLTALQHNEFLGQNFCLELKAAAVSRCQNYVMCCSGEWIGKGMKLFNEKASQA